MTGQSKKCSDLSALIFAAPHPPPPSECSYIWLFIRNESSRSSYFLPTRSVLASHEPSLKLSCSVRAHTCTPLCVMCSENTRVLMSQTVVDQLFQLISSLLLCLTAVFHEMSSKRWFRCCSCWRCVTKCITSLHLVCAKVISIEGFRKDKQGPCGRPPSCHLWCSTGVLVWGKSSLNLLILWPTDVSQDCKCSKTAVLQAH